jgi:hypothetical protein
LAPGPGLLLLSQPPREKAGSLESLIKHNQKTLMFSVVGLTLEDISAGALPQVRLAEGLDARSKQSHYPPGSPQQIVIYTTSGTDSQALVARTKYRGHGQFLVFLYFNDAAARACKNMDIPLRILDRVDEIDLPANRTTVLECSYLAPVSR